MSNNIIPTACMIGLYSAHLISAPSASFVVPTTAEIIAQKEDSWVQPTTMPCEYTARENLKSKLRMLEEDFFNEYKQRILSQTLKNTFRVLSKILDEGIALPHMAVNGQGEIGLTWDSMKYRIYLAIDGYDKLFLSIVNREEIQEYDCSQRNIEEDNDIVSKIRNVL